MTPTPFDTIQNHLTNGNAIPLIEGTLTNLWERKSGTHSNGDWSIQNGTLSDGNISIPVLFKDRDPVPEALKGQKITIQAKDGSKGLSGLYAFDDDYKDPPTRKIKVTPTAAIAPVGQGATTDGFQSEEQIAREHAALQQENGQPGQQASAPPQQAATPQGQSLAQQQASHDPLLEAKKTLVQITNLHVLCRMSLERIEAPLIKEITGRTMSEDEIRAATSSIFIKADKLGLNNEMPTRPFTREDFPAK